MHAHASPVALKSLELEGKTPVWLPWLENRKRGWIEKGRCQSWKEERQPLKTNRFSTSLTSRSGQFIKCPWDVPTPCTDRCSIAVAARLRCLRPCSASRFSLPALPLAASSAQSSCCVSRDTARIRMLQLPSPKSLMFTPCRRFHPRLCQSRPWPAPWPHVLPWSSPSSWGSGTSSISASMR